MMRQMDFSRLWVVVAAVIHVFFTVSICGGSDGQAAFDRLERSTVAALEKAPILRAVDENLDADEAAVAAERGAGTPWIGYTREGIGPSFERRPNSQDTLSLGIPFNGPGQGSKAKRLTEAAALRSAALKRVAVLDMVKNVGEEWIKMAAIEGRLKILGTRLDNLNQAVKLQQKRLELGEVAGTELMQLELARAVAASMKAGLQGDAEACRRRLRALCGSDCVFPVPGDLKSIQASLGPMDRNFNAADIEATPGARALMSDKAIVDARAELVGATVWGRPTVGVEWEHIPTMDGVEGFDAVGLQLSVPLPFGRSGKRQIEESRARSRSAAAWVEAEILDLKVHLESARAEADAASVRLAALKPVLNQLQKTEHSLLEQFRLGAVSYLVYIDGLSRLDVVQLEAVEANERLISSRLRLAVLADDKRLFPLPSMPSGENEEN